MAKICRDCKKNLPLSSFGKLQWAKDGLNYICKPCNSARGLVRYYAKKDYILSRMHQDRELNYERRVEVERRSRLKNKEKSRPSKNARQSTRNRLLGSNEFLILDKDLRRIYASPCVACGATKNQSLDHVIPISRGGRHSIGNIITLCKSCNCKKHNRFFSEWKFSRQLLKIGA